MISFFKIGQIRVKVSMYGLRCDVIVYANDFKCASFGAVIFVRIDKT